MLDKSIDSVANFFERFLLRWHNGTVNEIEQLTKEYDALIPRVHLELEEDIHEENINEDLVDEALHGTLLEDISEQPSDTVVIEDLLEQLDSERLYVSPIN